MVVVLYWLVHGKQNIWNGNKICARTNYSLKINLSSELNAYNFTKSTGFFTKNEFLAIYSCIIYKSWFPC